MRKKTGEIFYQDITNHPNWVLAKLIRDDISETAVFVDVDGVSYNKLEKIDIWEGVVKNVIDNKVLSSKWIEVINIVLGDEYAIWTAKCDKVRSRDFRIDYNFRHFNR